MTPDKRYKYIENQVKLWRTVFRIPSEWEIKLKFVTHRDDDDEKIYATIDRNMLPYGKATMEIYDEVFASKNFEKDASEAICHEVLHLALYPIVSYCHNMFSGDEGKQKHLEDLEEALVTTLERACVGLAARADGTAAKGK